MPVNIEPQDSGFYNPPGDGGGGGRGRGGAFAPGVVSGTYAGVNPSQSLLNIIVTLTTPGGDVYEISNRTLLEIGTITEATEDESFSIVHGDLDIQFGDSDGFFERLLSNATPDQVFILTIDRATGNRRPKYERVFAGVLDQPWSVQYNRRNRTVNIQAFSYSKLLERASAETVQRTIKAMTGSVAAAGTTVTVAPDTDDIMVGDTISLDDETNKEDQVVLQILTSTTVQTAAWTSAFAVASVLTVETPYYRNKTIEFLADSLFNASGISDHAYQLDAPLSKLPVLGFLNTTGLPNSGSGSITSVVEKSGKISVMINSLNKLADSPSSGFVAGGAFVSQPDWRPYLLTEPASLQAGSLSNGIDHTNAREYSLVVVVTGGSPNDTTELELHRNGVFLVTMDTYTAATGTNGYTTKSVEYDAVNNFVWMAFKRKTNAERLMYRNIGGSSTTTLSSAAGSSGVLCSIRGLSYMARFLAGNLYLYSLATRTIDRTLVAPAGLAAKTLRLLGVYLVGLWTRTGESRIVLWDTVTWEKVADYSIAKKVNALFLVGFQTSIEMIGVGFAGDVWFILSKQFLGVIPYADFANLSCAGALKELALLAMAYLHVDLSKTGILHSRAHLETNVELFQLDATAPLDQTTAPLWELYRTSCEVRGVDTAGNDIVAVGGATGDSSRRLTISSKLINTQEMAKAIAEQYVTYFGVIRSQEELQLAESGVVLHILDLLSLTGRKYRVTNAEMDLVARTQTIRAVEVA